MVKKRSFWVLIFGFIMSCLLGVTTWFYGKAEASVVWMYDGELDTYNVGETVDIPTGRALFDGEVYELDWNVVYPDGKSSTGNSVTLDKEGHYIVEYSFEANGKRYQDNRFMSAKYTLASLFTPGEGVALQTNVDTPEYATDYKYNGVGVCVANGVTDLSYNGIIDLNKLGSNTPFINFFVMPKKNNTFEMDAIEIWLTDIYDESNYLYFNVHSGYRYKMASSTFMITNACDMYAATGLIPVWGGGKITGYTLRKTSGAGNGISWQGKVDGEKLGGHGLYYNVGEKASYFFRYDYNSTRIMMDYDDPQYVGSDVWKGFTSNQVRLSMRIHATMSDANLLIYSIGGQSLSGTDLVFEENETLNFTADFLGQQEDSLLNGVARNDLYYPVFDGRFFNKYGQMVENVNTFVYFGKDRKPVPVIDGYFATPDAGTYYIEYVVEYQGKEHTHVIPVTVVDDPNGIAYEFDERLPDTAYVGDLLQIYEGEVTKCVGDVEKTVELVYNDKTVESFNYGLGDFLELTEKGTLLYKVTLKDFVGDTKTFIKTVNVVYNAKPTLIKPFVSGVVLKGQTADFSAFKAFLYTDNGKTDVPVSISVNGTDCSETMSYTPTETGAFTVVVKAVNPDVATEFTSETFTLTVKDRAAEEMYASAYFLYDNVTASYTDEYFRVTVADIEQQAGFSFLNPLPADNFSMNLMVEKEKNGYNSFFVDLYDANDTSLCVTLEFKRAIVYKVEGMTLSVNGVEKGVITGTFTDNTAMNLIYDNKSYVLRDGSNNAVVSELFTYANGKKFEGFPSGSVGVVVRFGETTGASELVIGSFVNQIFTGDTEEYTPPVIILDDNFATNSRVAVGSSVCIPAAKAFDVFDGWRAVSVLIVAPNGVRIYDGDISQDYTFVADVVGTYAVTYIAYDSYNNLVHRARRQCSVIAYEANAPTILVNVADKTVAVNETVEFAKATVSDDTDNRPYYYIVVHQKGKSVRWNVYDHVYTFTEKGEYVVTYVAYDCYWNSSVVEYTITVK